MLGIVVTSVLAMYVSKAAAGVVFLALVLGLALGLVPLVERRFFAMRCAFTFLVTEVLLRRGAIPPENTAEAAQQFLTGRFGDLAGPVCDAHNHVVRKVGSFFRTFDRLDEILPVDLGPVRSALGFVVDRVAPHIADLALSYALSRGATDYEQSADDAITYVAQNPKALLGTAVRAWITQRILGALVAMVTLVLFGGATLAAVGAMTARAVSQSGMPAEAQTTVGIFAAIFAAVLVGAPFASLASWFIRTAFLEPVSLTMLLIRFHATIQGQPLDPTIRARLNHAHGTLRATDRLANLFD